MAPEAHPRRPTDRRSRPSSPNFAPGSTASECSCMRSSRARCSSRSNVRYQDLQWQYPMALPSNLCELVHTSAFWSDYFGDEVFGEQVTGLPSDSYLSFNISPHHVLRVGYFWSTGNGEQYIAAT